MYTIFVRNWYKKERVLLPGYGNKYFTRLVPNYNARQVVIGTAATEDAARAMARQWNETHESGELQRKAEYTKN